MAEDIKIYYPNTIDDTDIYPDVSDTVSETSTRDGSNVEKLNTVDPTAFPTYISAKEVISVSLDTQKRKILGSYSFSETGAIQIGKYVSGVSGEIKISPDGLVATNKDGDATITIDGTTGDATFLGTIAAGSVVTGYLTIGGAAADVNTNATGISADRVSISGSTSFTPGYDPTSKVAMVGGNYTSTNATAAKVRIFPDANTGIVAYAANGTSEVFKVTVGGADVGDVMLGNYAGGSGALWDQSASTLYIKGNMTAGSISGVNITGGTITGTTIKTASSGVRVQITASNAKISLYDSGNDECALLDDYGGYIMLKALDSRDLTLDASGGDIYLDQLTHINGSLDMRTHSIYGVTTFTASSWGSFGGDLDMNSHLVTEISQACFQSRSGRASDSNGIWYYNSGGSYSFRSRMNSTNWRFDQTSV
jgi:hypothetical protein